jgi:hypothetical protein
MLSNAASASSGSIRCTQEGFWQTDSFWLELLQYRHLSESEKAKHRGYRYALLTAKRDSAVAISNGRYQGL